MYALKSMIRSKAQEFLKPSVPNVISERAVSGMQSPPALADPPRPIFIVGAPRSGTSISDWAIGQHPNIQPMPETAWIAAMAIGVQQSYLIGSERGRFSHLSNVALPQEPFFRRMGEAIDNVVKDVFEERMTRLHGDWRQLGEIRNPAGHSNPELLLRRHSSDPKTRWIDGTPMNSMYAYGIAQLFPEAQFLHLVRRPHEVVTSLANFDAVGGIKHQISEAIQNWLDHTTSAFKLQKALGPQRVYTALFDTMTSDPRSYFAGILNFLGEEWSEDCLAPLKQKINSSQVDGQREKIRAAIDRDPLYQRALRLYEEIAAYPTDAKPDAGALQELRARFEQHAMDRRLIG
jgi:hypothetical protein